jgi:hypothetical protein
METENCLFFGGPADGEWREVLVGAPQVLVRTLPLADPLAQNAWAYNRLVINSTHDRKHSVFVYGNIDPVRIMLGRWKYS